MSAGGIVVRVLGPGDERYVEAAVRYWGRDIVAGVAAAFLADDAVVAIGAFDDAELIGFAYGYLQRRPDTAAMANLYSLDVWPGHRRRGVATEIIAAFRRAAGPVAKFWVITGVDNTAANALYQSVGLRRQDGAEHVYFAPTP